MNNILYYSNFCEHSRKILQYISKKQISNIHFICIDKREIGNDGNIYIILQNNKKIIIPSMITKVPSLVLLKNKNILYGDDIYNYINNDLNNNNFNNSVEPLSFTFKNNSINSSNIVSDNFSYLNQNDNELSVKGEGGLRQLHNYVALNDNNINTNIDFNIGISNNNNNNNNNNNIENKIKEGEFTIETLQKKREQEFNNIKINNI